MNSRQRILQRLRSAAVEAEPIPERCSGSKYFADYPRKEQLKQVFIERLTLLKGEVVTVKSAEEGAAALQKLIKNVGSNVKAFALAGKQLALLLSSYPALTACIQIYSDQEFRAASHQTIADFKVGISEAGALIARSGSIGIADSSRRISLFPEVHVVLANESQLCASVVDWIVSIQDRTDWSVATLISGPSRTSDIEKILVLGAHGPKRLVVILHEN